MTLRMPPDFMGSTPGPPITASSRPAIVEPSPRVQT
eukprot:CAMPEP_0185753876 /NCGR_PEP_ID=MMETSP1174-20130828/12572_1 /TAXON_ID=35687 /ORGANISM="Dictyocha speculum, Strain CCMP1381" /LENGTH=35 /DNA_ID= /DNA_START= /DNA_END= /DNA_ORIENTATION=